MIPGLCLFVFICCTADSRDAQERMRYENRNQIDYGPLVVRSVNGFVADAQGGSIPAANVGVFTESDHKLLFQTTTDSDGFFRIEGLSRGEYRLVSQYAGFCPANARIVVVGWPRGGFVKSRRFRIRMVGGGIDTCSEVTYREPAQPAAAADR